MIDTHDEKLQELTTYMQSMKDTEHPESYLIAILHKTQELYGYVPQEAMDTIALEMSIPTSHIWGVATFYHYFNLKPRGAHTIAVCMGTACYVKGADAVLEALKKELKVQVGETTEDRLFTLQEARCLGACGLAPVMMIDEKIYGNLTPQRVKEIIASYRDGKPL